MSAADSTASRPSETVAGYLAALAIFIALIGLAWHPLRLILPAIVVSMIAALEFRETALAAGEHRPRDVGAGDDQHERDAGA